MSIVFANFLANLLKIERGREMRPKRYPYSGKRKKPIRNSIDFVIDQNIILQSVVVNSPLKRPESDL